MLFIKKIFPLIFIFFLYISLYAQHPKLVLTQNDVNYIKSNLEKAPLFQNSMQKAIDELNGVVGTDVDVPYPVDPGGGYTHERHKKNYNLMHLSGILYSVTGEEKYAVFIRDMLRKYSEFYYKLGNHPQGKKQTPGRMFWQSLNETVWLLHTIQAYDCIYDWLSPEDRDLFEKNIFTPMVNFFLTDCIHEFDLIHNHGTWTVAAVGMAGYVMGNKDWVDMALYGSKKDGQAGFIKQLELLFSPDGYYTEGAYYVRYALWPFFIFAEVIENNQPELKIYGYRNEILKKAFYAAMQLTYTNGEFIPINDALKEKTIMSPEIIYASNFVYKHYEHDKGLLSIVRKHNEVSFTGAGMLTAIDFANAETIPNFNWHSVEFHDGPNGDEGGLSIMRSGEISDQEALLFKYTSHGLSHGHYDKLHFLFYDQGTEIIQDYGAARFLNVPQKFGGRYLEENDTYALQTIAHNTVVVDEETNFGGIRDISQANHSERFFVDLSNPDFQFSSAKENNAYPGVAMQRTMVMLKDDNFTKPIILDVFKVDSENEHTYDLPFYYMGHLISTNVKYDAFTNSRKVLGKSNGYQHLWIEAKGQSNKIAQITWLNNNRFYSITNNGNSEVYYTRVGANDPEFNLRNDPGYMLRVKSKSHVFASVIEPHGEFNPTMEYTLNPFSTIKNIEVVYNDENFTAINYTANEDLNWTLVICNSDPSETAKHNININNKNFEWSGPIMLFK